MPHRRDWLNIGCGSTFHRDWTNVDVISIHDDVIAANIISGLPFSNDSFSVVYMSHVLEHLNQKEAKKLIHEIYRVLKPGGIVRLVVPDLETLARQYLRLLDTAEKGGEQDAAHYEWGVIELLDQLVRPTPGGVMGEFLQDLPANCRELVKSRLGAEAELYWKSKSAEFLPTVKLTSSLKRYPLKFTISKVWQRFLLNLSRGLIRVLLGKRGVEALNVGIFRVGGEPHLWMYDRRSLRILLEGRQFFNIKIVGAGESSIIDFSKYEFDEVRGQPRKPDSIFVEAIK